MSPKSLLFLLCSLSSACLAADVATGRDSGYSDGGGGSAVDFLAPLVLLAPLAGLAALYTAAAINANSALVTLATLNTGKKKRSAVDLPSILAQVERHKIPKKVIRK